MTIRVGQFLHFFDTFLFVNVKFLRVKFFSTVASNFSASDFPPVRNPAPILKV
jgi:hypothetical protein